jgi:WD40 repeat protein
VAIADGLRGVGIWTVPSSLTGGERPAGAPGVHLTIQGHTTALGWSADGALLAAGSREGSVVLWQTRHAWREASRDLGSTVWALAWAPRGRLLAAGLADGTARLLDGAGLRAVRSLGPPPRGGTAGTGGTVRQVRDYGVGLGPPGSPASRQPGGPAINALAWSGSGDLLSVTATGAPLRFWRLESGTVVGSYRDNWDMNAMAWLPDGSLMAVAADDGHVTLLRAAPVSSPMLATFCGAREAHLCTPLAGAGGEQGAPPSYMGR